MRNIYFLNVKARMSYIILVRGDDNPVFVHMVPGNIGFVLLPKMDGAATWLQRQRAEEFIGVALDGRGEVVYVPVEYQDENKERENKENEHSSGNEENENPSESEEKES